MKVNIFITTYNAVDDLNNCLKSLFESDINKVEYSVNIINNNTNFKLINNYNVKIYNNQCRPDFSTGHLSRTWNQCIINGFKSITNPDCDVLITMQDDQILKNNWFSLLLPHIEKNSFIEIGGGDIMCIYKPSSIYNVGLWDERFCGIGYQEGDYFLRQLIYNKENISINDYCHGRIYNPIYAISNRKREIDNEYLRVPSRNSVRSTAHHKSAAYHDLCNKFFLLKWGIESIDWNIEHIKNNVTPKIDSYIMYPYFEYQLNLPELRLQRYFVI